MQVKPNMISNDVPRGGRDPLIVSESGFWGLITNSRKPAVEPVKYWIRSDVLPAIRKTGVYNNLTGIPLYNYEHDVAAVNYWAQHGPQPRVALPCGRERAGAMYARKGSGRNSVTAM
jgi:hypothetical protein